MIVILAHHPLATALQAAALHILPEAAPYVLACDVPASEPPLQSVSRLQEMVAAGFKRPDIGLGAVAVAQDTVLILTDILGATPCNVAALWSRQFAGQSRTVCGVNLAMVMRAITYRMMHLDEQVERALSGGKMAIQAC